MWSNAQNILAIIHVVQFFAPCHLAVNQYGHIFIYWVTITPKQTNSTTLPPSLNIYYSCNIKLRFKNNKTYILMAEIIPLNQYLKRGH